MFKVATILNYNDYHCLDIMRRNLENLSQFFGESCCVNVGQDFKEQRHVLAEY
jgi:hypothetical protein